MIKENDVVEFSYFNHKKKGVVTKVGLINGGYFCGKPCVSVYEAWGDPDSHAPMTTCGHNFCFMKTCDGSWKDLDNGAVLDSEYWEDLNKHFLEV